MKAYGDRGVWGSLKTQRPTVLIFHFPSKLFFQNKQVIEQWESWYFGPVVSRFLYNLQCRPMFHHVFVQTQIKPGSGVWGLELWKENPVEVFSTSPCPNHVIPGRALAKIWQRPHTGWQTTKICGFVIGRPPPTPWSDLPLPLRPLKWYTTWNSGKSSSAALPAGNTETWGQTCI